MDVKEINLLPVNSNELDDHLMELGMSLVSFAKEYDFSKKCFDVDDCDFIQSVLIEFIFPLKPYFIPFLAVTTSDIRRGDRAIIKGDYHTESFITETALNASEYDLVLDNKYTAGFWMVNSLKELMLNLRKMVFNQKLKWKYKRLDEQLIPDSSTDKFRLLLTTFNINTLYTLTPIQDELLKRTDVFQLYIANKISTYNRLKSLGYKNILNCWRLSSSGTLHLKKEVYNDFINNFFETKFHLGKPTKRFRQVFSQRLFTVLESASALYPKLKRVVKEYSPNALLMSSCSTTDAQILIHLCNSQKIRVIEITHGMFYETPILKFQNVPVKVVWNKMQRDSMNKYRPEVFCPVLGNPKHDVLLKKFNQSLPPRAYKMRYILLVSSPGRNTSLSWATYLTVLEEYIEVAKVFYDFTFILKLHPSEDPVKIEKEVGRLGAPKNFIIEQHENVYELLFYAEIVVVITSSVGFEALLWDKKIICYTVPNSEKWLPFAQYNLAKQVKNKEELGAAIRYFMQNPSLTIGNSFKDYFAFSDGNSLNNILNYILTDR
jgi:hypothetical protein